VEEGEGRTVPGELLDPIVLVPHRDELLPSNGENPSVGLVEPVLVVAVDSVVSVEERLRTKRGSESAKFDREETFRTKKRRLTETAGR